ncbi:MAG TPA: acyltransferase family protein [Jatrophihabitantaceae bacterium]
MAEPAEPEGALWRNDDLRSGLTESENTIRFAPLRVLEAPRDNPAERPAQRRRLRGLDGLRAVAVLAVVAFHLDYALLPGGFLGVDIFFVISGFLITYLLVGEILETGRLRLRAFYLRRARRLMPAVGAVLLAVTIAGTTVWRDQLPTLRGGVLSSLGYVTNWWLISDHQSYFIQSGRPTMLQHLWSLAIEEQFYLVWSVVVLATFGLLFAGGRSIDAVRGTRRLIGVAIAAAVSSAAAMAVFAEHGDLPYNGSVSRVYFGSDTHSMGLFLGAAGGAAFALGLRRRTATSPRKSRPKLLPVTDALGLLAIGVVVYEMAVTSEFRPGLYRGGFLAFAAIVLIAIRCAVRSGSLFGRVLDIRPVRWIGRRSYSIYIWHWPIAMVTRPGLDVPGPVVLVNLARFALILAVSALSYRFIELPLRSGQFRTWLRARRKRPVRALEIVAVAATLAIAGTFAVVGKPALAWDGPKALPQPRPQPSHSAVAPPPSHGSRQPGRPVSRHAGGTKPGGGPAKTTKHHNQPGTPTRHGGVAARPGLSAFGDSVLLGAGPVLRDHTRLEFDAVEGRQAFDVLNDIARDAQRGTLAQNILIHIGNNGIISPSQLADVLQSLAKYRRVVLLTDRVSRDWQDPNNQTIHSVAAHFANVQIVDWYAISARHSDWLYSDGLHLTSTGAAHYTALVMAAIERAHPTH